MDRSQAPFPHNFMNYSTQKLQINIHKVDGSIVTFSQSEAVQATQILSELDPAGIFNQERIAIAGDDAVAMFTTSLITRVDLITDQLSVWDFPFVVGALLELTGAEFHGFLHEQQRLLQTHPASDFPIFLDVEMVNRRHAYLWAEVVAGFPAERLSRACSLLKERSLIFGLRTSGIGVLNPANLVRLTMHPDSLNGLVEVWHTHEVKSRAVGYLARNPPESADDE
jgi:hypothetical protein